jgi:DNA-binding HxlR family transcriptional regulator
MSSERCVPIEILQFLSRKWALLILSSLIRDHKLRYSELISRLGGISPKTLTERLRELEGEGIIKRELFAEVPPRVEYSLTKKGIELAASLVHVLNWVEKWYPAASESPSANSGSTVSRT